MKIDRVWFDSYEYKGQKLFRFEQIEKDIGAYVDIYSGCEQWFELDTNERIGYIDESMGHVRAKQYYNAGCEYGWDGSKKSRKEFWKTLCTRADYSTARSLLIAEYKSRK